MMTREEFFEDIYSNVCVKLQEHLDKVTGVPRGIREKDTAVKRNSKAGSGSRCLPFAAVTDLGEMYVSYLKGRPIEEIRGMVEEVGSCFISSLTAVSEMENVSFEEIKDRIVCSVISSGLFSSGMEKQLYDDYTYFKALYYVMFEENGEIKTLVPVSIRHLEAWEKDRDDIYDAAMENQLRAGILLVPLDEACEKEIPEIVEFNCYETKRDREVFTKTGIFLLTSQSLQFSVSLMLNETVLSRIYGYFGDNYYVLPVSIYEVLIIPDRNRITPGQVRGYHESIYKPDDFPEEEVCTETFYYNGAKGQLVRVCEEGIKPEKWELIFQNTKKAVPDMQPV